MERTLTTSKPKRGEIWQVDLDPTIGSEMKKQRPALIISSDALNTTLPLSLIAPITNWKEDFEDKIWFIKIEPDKFNGLLKTSAITALQIRSLDQQRFIKRLGKASPAVIENAIAAVAAVIEYE